MTWVIVLIVLVVLVLIALAIMANARKKKRSEELKDRFGPEYDRAVDQHDSRRKAESELSDVAHRRDTLDIRELTAAERDRFTERWMAVQATFVDDPGEATRDADRLVGEVMRDRGYPVDDFDTKSDMIAADHPHIAENYRAAHSVAGRHSSGTTTTDDLREGFMHFRALFDELLGSHPGAAGVAPAAAAGTGTAAATPGAGPATGAPTGGAPTGSAPTGGAPSRGATTEGAPARDEQLDLTQEEPAHRPKT
jgi:hypothetical protein